MGTATEDTAEGVSGSTIFNTFPSSSGSQAFRQENHKILTNLLKVYTLLLDFTGPMGPMGGSRSFGWSFGVESVKSTIERQRFSHLDIKEIYEQPLAARAHTHMGFEPCLPCPGPLTCAENCATGKLNLPM